MIMTVQASQFYDQIYNCILIQICSYEFAVKIVSRGFIMDKFTYLRDGWNWLDFAIIISYVELFVGDYEGHDFL